MTRRRLAAGRLARVTFATWAAKSSPTPWDFANPHVVTLEVLAADIDAYDHVNNAVYLSWLDRAAWTHSATLGLSLEQCLAMRRGMARTPDADRLRAGRVCWATACWSAHGSSTPTRDCVSSVRFQIRRAADGETLARARIDYVCINLDSGRAVRMPESFSQRLHRDRRLIGAHRQV